MNGAHGPLDAVDRALAEALVETPRATIRDLATAVGLSHSATRTRVNDLIASDVVEVLTLVHPAACGRTTHFYATLTCRPGTPVDLGGVPGLHSAPGVWRHHDTARFQALMSARGTEGVHAFLREVSALPWVEHAAATIVLKTHSAGGTTHRPGVPAGPWDAPAVTSLDATDRAIARYLPANGRASYTELSVAVGLSLTAARRRVLALLGADVIRFVTVVDLPGAVHAVLHLDVDAAHREQLLGVAVATEGVVTTTELVGPHDIACTVVVPDERALAAAVGAIVAVPGVTGHDLRRFTVLRPPPTRRADAAPTG